MGEIKVLMVGNSPTVKGGITSVINQIMSHNWAEDGVDMRFIPTYIDANNVSKMVFFAKAYYKIKRELKSFKPDVVHIHMSYRGSFARKFLVHRLCKKNGIRDIIHLHGSEFKKWYDELGDKENRKVRTLLRECDAFIVLGNKWNEVIKSIEPDAKTVVVSNTVKAPDEMVKWNPNRTQILFLGVLIKRKGTEDLLWAIKKLSDTGKLQNVRFAIAGTGPEEQNLKDLARALEIENVIDFLGWTEGEKKRQVLTESQILVLPSYNEGLPIAILEAMSYGMPVIATDVGDISSAVKDGVNGYLVKPGDIAALSDKINCLSSDKQLHKRFSIESKKTILSEFSDEEYFHVLKECYKGNT